MNNYAAIGRLTAMPEIMDVPKKGTDETITFVTFTLAVPRIGSEDADFIRCKAFGTTADFIADYLEKGQRVGITGRLQSGKYEKDGVTHWTTDVIVDRVDFADGKAPESDKPARKAEAKPAGKYRRK